MKFSLLLLFNILILGCQDEKKQNDEPKTKTLKQTVITQKVIEDFNYMDYALSPEAEERLKPWAKYQELNIQINFLKKADLSFFNGDIEVLKQFITAFKDEIPDELTTNPIVSRMVVIETKLLKLHDNLTLTNIDSKLQLLSIKEVLVAFSNLNYQVNKKLEEDFYNKIKPE